MYLCRMPSLQECRRKQKIDGMKGLCQTNDMPYFRCVLMAAAIASLPL